METEVIASRLCIIASRPDQPIKMKPNKNSSQEECLGSFRCIPFTGTCERISTAKLCHIFVTIQCQIWYLRSLFLVWCLTSYWTAAFFTEIVKCGRFVGLFVKHHTSRVRNQCPWSWGTVHVTVEVVVNPVLLVAAAVTV